jgi:sporulation protein YlmC with PRC-barrel domain
MEKERTLEISDLKGMSILAADSGERLGEVTDAIIHPTKGRLLGIALKTTAGERRVLGVQEIRIGEDAIMAAPGTRPHAVDDVEELRDGISTVDNIIGANVVTAAGKLIGRISNVYVSIDRPRTAYRIAESTLQRWFGGGFFIAGDVPSGYATDRPRFIVPEDVEERCGADSITEALNRQEEEKASSPE